MAGAHIEFDATGQIGVLQQLADHLADLKPVFREIGEYLTESHRQRFIDQVDPDGHPWIALSPATVARKERHPDLILVLNEYLADRPIYQVGDDELRFGTDAIYGAVHQFGARKGQFGTTATGAPIPWGNIPARPWLGLSETDAQEISDIVQRYLMED